MSDEAWYGTLAFLALIALAALVGSGVGWLLARLIFRAVGWLSA